MAKAINAKEEIINIVVDPIVKQKIRYIADQNDRSMTAEIHRVLRNYIKEYELKNSDIPLSM